MGAIIKMIIQGLTVGAPVAVGYWFNDLASWVASVTGQGDKVTTSDGKAFKPWFVVAVAIVAGLVVTFAVKMFSGRKKLFILALLSLFDYLIGAQFSVITAGLLFSIAASSTESKSIPFCPEYITFNIGTVPTGFRIEVIGDGLIFGVDGAGLTNLNGIRLVGALPSNQYVYQIANGFIKKNTTFVIENAAAAIMEVKGWSDSPGNMYVMHNQAKAFANASLDVEHFLYAVFPSAAATDTFTITWKNGTSDNLTRLELESLLGYTQEVTATRYNVDNLKQRILKIQFRGAADQAIYYTRTAGAKGVVNQSL